MTRRFLIGVVRIILRWLTKDSGLVKHAMRELRTCLTAGTNDPDRWMAEGTLDLIMLLAIQGHSGGSIGFALQWFDTLARFKPLGPLTGEDDEWVEVGEGLFQNARCGRVFKKDGEAYDSEGFVFVEPNGACYTSIESRVPVTFPYTPNTEYVNAD